MPDVRRIDALLIAATLWIGSAKAADSVDVSVRNSPRAVPGLKQDKRLLIEAASLAAVFNWEAKVVSGGKVLALCRKGGDELCVPVSLRNVATVREEDRLFVDAVALVRAMNLQLVEKENRITVFEPEKGATPDIDEHGDIPAYNAAWGDGRGFHGGQTLPDIPLLDMHGREVRFSQFLGKQYILYCWASW